MSIISSRTPEGWPAECPVCGSELKLLFSSAGDAACPSCGSLIWRVMDALDRARQALVEQLGVDPDRITPDTTIVGDLGADSLDRVELVMELEEQFDVQIPDADAENIQSLRDLLRYLEKRRREEET